jgi:2-oxoglutarate ferredoxin oxidoreductase subunit alpha
MKKIAIEAGNLKVFGTAAVGALTELFGIEFNNIESLFSKKWDAKVVEANAKAYQKGRETSRKHFELPKGHEDKHIMINGNEAIALGAIAGGLDFYSAYPMTPATSIMTYLSKKQKQAGMIVEQVEDEISAINMALGASYAGARAATGSSGGGVSLMLRQ